jgi:hypothetical protein
VKFRVEYIFASQRPVSLIVRQVDSGEFALTTSPRLGGVPIRRTLTQPRAQKPDGTPDFSVFMFTLTDARNAKEFSIGQIIELEP